MSRINIDLTKYDAEFLKTAMSRVENAADVIRDAAKSRCVVGAITRPAKGQFWTERSPGAMKATIRVVRKEGKNNVLVIAGNKKTWWATQMEYGRGGWKGGAKPFMRPAIAATKGKVSSIIEGG
ncbi:MAG TPA: HK97-gp10 family putative phage morphogenesis protein [Dissulfurispiraceae bacterium]|nr:HK97-gp10 family putative phage morphogenesis protein [Dissulfurispiraceae bacterium]